MMKQYQLPPAQRGSALIVGLIMLVVITLMVTTSFTLSNSNLKSVGNMQFRNEAIAAANKAIEQEVGSWTMTTAPAAEQINVDIDNNGSTDYIVNIGAPTCLSASAKTAPGDPGSDCTPSLDGSSTCANAAATSVFTLIWDIDATATGVSSGSQVRIRQGVSKSASQAQCDALCPPTAGAPCA